MTGTIVEINLQKEPWLKGHQINGFVVLPGAYFIEIILESAQSLFGTSDVSLSDVQLKKAVFLSDTEFSKKFLPSFLVTSDTRASFELKSDNELIVTGTLKYKENSPLVEDFTFNVEEFTLCSSQDFYNEFLTRGLQYEDAFRGVKEIYRNSGRSMGHVEISTEYWEATSPFIVHPAILDCFLQSLGGATSIESHSGVVLPIGFGDIRVSGKITDRKFKVSTQVTSEEGQTLKGKKVSINSLFLIFFR